MFFFPSKHGMGLVGKMTRLFTAEILARQMKKLQDVLQELKYLSASQSVLVILLMGSFSHYLHARWCRISSISSMLCV